MSDVMQDAELPEAAPQQEPPTDAAGEWLRFVTATDSQVFAASWLGFLAQRIGQVAAAALLVESPQDKAFAPLAVWPVASADMERLGKVIEACLKERRGQVTAVAGGKFHVAYPVMRQDRLVAVVAVELVATAIKASLALQEIHWACAWILQLLGGRDLESATRARDRLSAVLDQMAGLSRHGKLQQGLFESVNALRVFFGCTRVAMGLVKGHQVRLMALSEAAEFDRHSALSKAYVEAMAEAMDVGQVLRVDGEAGQQDSLSRLAALRTASGAQALVAQPLKFEGQVIAVVVLERAEGVWSDQDLEWLDAFSAMAAPLVRFRQQAEHGVLRRAKGRVEELLHRLFGPGT